MLILRRTIVLIQLLVQSLCVSGRPACRSCECRVLSGRGLCDELITRPEESYRLCCVVVCDLETSRMGVSYIYDISRLRVKEQEAFIISALNKTQIYRIKRKQHRQGKHYAWGNDKCTQNLSLNT